jgi:hypothetical protein
MLSGNWITDAQQQFDNFTMMIMESEHSPHFSVFCMVNTNELNINPSFLKMIVTQYLPHEAVLVMSVINNILYTEHLRGP